MKLIVLLERMNLEEERSVKDPCLRIIKVQEEMELLNGRNRCVVSLSVLQFWAYKLSKTGEQKVIQEKDSCQIYVIF